MAGSIVVKQLFAPRRRKGQVDGLDRNTLLECKFINELFGIVD